MKGRISMKLKKLLLIILAFVLCFSSLTVIAYAEENADAPSCNEGFMPTLPPSEDVEVSVVYRPLKSFVSFGNFGPFFGGAVFKITYSDGTSENITLEKSDNDFSEYVAGDYYIYYGLFETMEIKTPGINKKTIVIDGFKNDINYSGNVNLSYLYIPTPIECYYLLTSLFKIYS